MSNQHKTGKEVFKNIFGDKAEEIENMLNDLSPELARIGIDFPFGEFYANDDLLDLKSRELITISTLITQGTLPQLKIHISIKPKNFNCSYIDRTTAVLG